LAAALSLKILRSASGSFFNTGFIFQRLQEFLREEDVGNGSAPRFARKKNWINHRLMPPQLAY
jgi:hypothetical protein